MWKRMGNLESIKQAGSVLDNFNPSLAFPKLLRCINKVRNELIQRFESLENLMTLLCQIDGEKTDVPLIVINSPRCAWRKFVPVNANSLSHVPVNEGVVTMHLSQINPICIKDFIEKNFVSFRILWRVSFARLNQT